MQAAYRKQYGPPAVLRVIEVPKPEPRADEILVKVHATTVNRTDCGILTASPWVIRLFTGLSKPKKPTTGTDFAGVVEAVGAAVSTFQAGDRVFGFDDNGLSSHAEYLSISASKAIATMPDTCTFQQAAASLEGAHYAINFINKVSLKAGQKVMVYGATGAIGSAALQFLKHYGLTVTGVGNTKNLELLRSLGADKVIDYEQTDFTQDEERYPFIFDAVGKSSFGQCKPLLTPNGVYISSELGPGGENIYLPLLTKIRGGKRVKFPLPYDIKASLRFIKPLLESGQFQPVIDRSYPLKDIREAFEYVSSGQKTGNVLLEMA
ncbi:MAG TPA: NAD(P)-dependent alcohol dehydrogenase [Saprospiraceae bacterium]|nr:NAD(P)-dependent alcohol dehydrogenase [Saprospiraceae bacterium]HMQ84411.1 NAD(P)-dependent alcohol dehydrogenase [Saprospiraceae bacterium]